MTLPVLPSPRLPKQGLIDIIKFCSGVGVVWGTAKRPHMGQTPGQEHAWIRLSLVSYVHVGGEDELRVIYDPVNDVRVNLLVGQRQFTTQVTARSMDPKLEAFDLCERVLYRLGTRLDNPEMQSVFPQGPLGPILSLNTWSGVRVQNEEVADDRIVLAASVDIKWNLVVYADPNQAGEGLLIESATVGPGTLLE